MVGGQGIVRIHLNRLSGIRIPANVKKCVICFIKRLLIYVWRAGLSRVIISRSTDRAGKVLGSSSEGGRLGEGGSVDSQGGPLRAWNDGST